MIVPPNRILNLGVARAGVIKAEAGKVEEAAMVVNSEDVVVAMVLEEAEEAEVVAVEIEVMVFPVVVPIRAAAVGLKVGEVVILPRVVWESWVRLKDCSLLIT